MLTGTIALSGGRLSFITRPPADLEICRSAVFAQLYGKHRR
jgi:hypothetical protein